MSKQKVIVIGINGHVGHHIAKAFVEAGWDVTGFGRSNRQPIAGVRFVKGDAESVVFVREHAERYVTTIDAVVRFLQNKDPGLALRITARDLLPEGPRFAATEQGPGSEEDDPLGWAFGNLGSSDRAKHLASLYIDDLADAIREGIAPDFELARYAERLAASAPTFDALRDALDDLVAQAQYEQKYDDRGQGDDDVAREVQDLRPRSDAGKFGGRNAGVDEEQRGHGDERQPDAEVLANQPG